MKPILMSATVVALVVSLFIGLSAASSPKDLLILSEKNTINLNMPIDGSSAKTVQLALLDKSAKLSAAEPIYLFLNSPGGSIDAGQRIIETAHGIPQKVHTVSLFSASMSFIISQYLNNRYITENGVMMSHRAYGGGMEGQIPGNLITRTLFTLAQIVAVDAYVAKRAGIPTKQYQDLIANELWMEPSQAEQLKFADKTVRIRCDSTLRGPAAPIKLQVFVFNVELTYHKCPLITEPLSIKLADDITPRAKSAVESIIHDKAGFYHEYVQSNRLSEVLQ
jgi:ATP-dependent Clp protease protease subunit